MRSRRLFLPALVLMAASCARPLDRIQLSLGGASFQVEVARTDEERQRGLMHRDKLGDREGMLFVFESDQHLGFWMKDTAVPLSIAFLSASGRIEEIADMEPYSLKVLRSRMSCRYALEVARGTFAGLGVKEGDLIELPEGFR